MKKLDMTTKLYLKVTGAVIKEHVKVEKVKQKLELLEPSKSIKEVYVFNNYEEYKDYFLMFLDDISDETIMLAIYTISSNGQIIALKGLCNQIIGRILSNKSNRLVLKNN